MRRMGGGFRTRGREGEGEREREGEGEGEGEREIWSLHWTRTTSMFDLGIVATDMKLQSIIPSDLRR
jgi:hypothetical protein